MITGINHAKNIFSSSFLFPSVTPIRPPGVREIGHSIPYLFKILQSSALMQRISVPFNNGQYELASKNSKFECILRGIALR